MADITVQSASMDSVGPHDRARALKAFKLGDSAFYWTTRSCAILVLLILGGIILSLIVGAWPAMKAFGFEFLWTSRWAPSAQPSPVLGALGPVYGTLVTSVIAMAIAIPVGLGIAISVYGFVSGGVSWQGHLGGFVAGALAAAVVAYAPKANRSLVQWVGLGLLAAVLVAAAIVRAAALS